MCPPVIAIAASVAFTPVVSGVVGSVLGAIGITSALVATTVTGALVGGLSSVMAGGSFGQGALFGGLGGLVSGAIPDLVGSSSSTTAAASSAAGADLAMPDMSGTTDFTAQIPSAAVPNPTPFGINPSVGLDQSTAAPTPSTAVVQPSQANAAVPKSGVTDVSKGVTQVTPATTSVAPTSTSSIWSKFTSMLQGSNKTGEIISKAIGGGLDAMAKASAQAREAAAQRELLQMKIQGERQLSADKYASLGTTPSPGYLQPQNTASAQDRLSAPVNSVASDAQNQGLLTGINSFLPQPAA